jgi:hypothetical protein
LVFLSSGRGSSWMAPIALERQLRRLRSRIHVYGHSRLNRWMVIDGVTYLNNTLGNPSEGRIAAKRLVCVRP